MLDTLLRQESAGEAAGGSNAAYKLTLMKKLSQSTKPAKVKERVADLQLVEARYRLLKPVLDHLICWNYLYLSQKLAEIDDPAKREELLQTMAHGSAAAWGHLNLLGEYDFSEDKLQDSVGIKPPWDFASLQRKLRNFAWLEFPQRIAAANVDRPFVCLHRTNDQLSLSHFDG